MTTDVVPEVATEVRGRTGVLTLVRPRALNALTLPMIRALDAQLAAWSTDPAIDQVTIRGDARAFCAGGDVRAVREAVLEAKAKGTDAPLARDFFAEEYRLNLRIARYPKPYMAVIDGYAMGGGLGISVHGSHRVVSGNALLGMPETAIGMVPDVGATYFLSRLPGAYGTYLALTGTTVGVAAAVELGLATAYVFNGQEEVFDLADLRRLAEQPPSATLEYEEIDRFFAFDRLDEIFAALRAHAGESIFARRALEALDRASPLSLAVTLRLLREARTLDLESCLRAEYRAVRAITWTDHFAEGVRAVLVDKDLTPRFPPVRTEDIECAFQAPPEGDWSADSSPQRTM